jgi:hypothetical protein
MIDLRVRVAEILQNGANRHRFRELQGNEAAEGLDLLMEVQFLADTLLDAIHISDRIIACGYVSG